MFIFPSVQVLYDTDCCTWICLVRFDRISRKWEYLCSIMTVRFFHVTVGWPPTLFIVYRISQTPQAQGLHLPMEGYFGGSPFGLTRSGTVGHTGVAFLGGMSQQWGCRHGRGLLCVRTVLISTLSWLHHCHRHSLNEAL